MFFIHGGFSIFCLWRSWHGGRSRFSTAGKKKIHPGFISNLFLDPTSDVSSHRLLTVMYIVCDYKSRDPMSPRHSTLTSRELLCLLQCNTRFFFRLFPCTVEGKYKTRGIPSSTQRSAHQHVHNELGVEMTTTSLQAMNFVEAPTPVDAVCEHPLTPPTL